MCATFLYSVRAFVVLVSGLFAIVAVRDGKATKHLRML